MTVAMSRNDTRADSDKTAVIRLYAGAANLSVQADGVAALGAASAMLLGLLARRRGRPLGTLTTTMIATGSHALVDRNVDYPGRAELGGVFASHPKALWENILGRADVGCVAVAEQVAEKRCRRTSSSRPATASRRCIRHSPSTAGSARRPRSRGRAPRPMAAA